MRNREKALVRTAKMCALSYSGMCPLEELTLCGLTETWGVHMGDLVCGCTLRSTLVASLFYKFIFLPWKDFHEKLPVTKKVRIFLL